MTSLKRIAWAYGCAKKGSDEELQLYRALVARVCAEVQKRPIGEMIAESSIGAGLADIKERGIEAHLVDLDREMGPKASRPRRKR